MNDDDLIYHATNDRAFALIQKDGIVRPGWDGLIYFTNTPGYALGFLGMHGFRVMTGKTIEVADGLVVPESYIAEKVYVLAIEAGNTDMVEGVDHNPTFYPDDLEVWCHNGEIPLDQFADIYEYDVADLIASRKAPS